MFSRQFICSTSLAALMILPATAFAQVRPPAAAQPGRVGEQLRMEERPSVGGDSVITVPDEKGEQKSVKGGMTFLVSSIKFENLTAFKEEDLRPDYQAQLGTKISVGELNAIAARITLRYRNAGYILSRAVVPPQRIENGVVTIRIVEGYINSVEFQGLPAGATGLLAAYAQKIQNTKPLDAATLERYLLFMNDLPGVSAQAVLRPAKNVPGASDVFITIVQKKIDGDVSLDNRGTRYMGPLQGGLTVNANNIVRLNERTSLRGLTTDPATELKYGQIVHEEQLGSEGTKLAVSAGYTHTHPGYILEPTETVGRDILYSAVVSHPFLRSRQNNIYGNVQFDIRKTDLNQLGVKFYDDHTKVARIGGSYDFTDRWLGVNNVDATVSHGFGWDVASINGFRSTNGSPVFTKLGGTASRLQPVYGPVNVYVAATGQAASRAVLSSEQFGVGGAGFGSAYDASEITGDSGFAGRFEVQYNRAGDVVVVPTYQLYGFYDGGAVWLRDPSAGSSARESLVSTGLGLRFNAIKDISGSLEWAMPVTKKVSANGADGAGSRVFFNLGYKY